MPSIGGYSDLGSSTHRLNITLLACSCHLSNGNSHEVFPWTRVTVAHFLKLIGSPALAAALPLDLSRVLAIPAHNRTGTIADVEHIVILMQENRSFDHYFGTMRGVRGFADPRAVTLPSGKPVWHQPNGAGHAPAVPSRRRRTWA